MDRYNAFLVKRFEIKAPAFLTPGTLLDHRRVGGHNAMRSAPHADAAQSRAHDDHSSARRMLYAVKLPFSPDLELAHLRLLRRELELLPVVRARMMHSARVPAASA